MPLVVYGQILRLRSLAFTSLRMTHCPRSFSPPKNVGNAVGKSEWAFHNCGNAAGKSEWAFHKHGNAVGKSECPFHKCGNAASDSECAFHKRGNAVGNSERGLLCHSERKTVQAVWSRRIWLSFFIMPLVVYGQILRLRSLAFTTLRMTHFFVHWRSLRLRMTRFFVRVGSIRYE